MSTLEGEAVSKLDSIYKNSAQSTNKPAQISKPAQQTQSKPANSNKVNKDQQWHNQDRQQVN